MKISIIKALIDSEIDFILIDQGHAQFILEDPQISMKLFNNIHFFFAETSYETEILDRSHNLSSYKMVSQYKIFK